MLGIVLDPESGDLQIDVTPPSNAIIPLANDYRREEPQGHACELRA